MTPGDLLVAGAAGAGLGLLVLLVLPRNPWRDRLAPLLLAAAVLLLGAALALLTHAFLADDFSYEVVWRFSSTDLPVHYKLAALYTSQEGSFLLWTFLTFLWAKIFASRKFSRADAGDSGFRRRLLAGAVVTGLALAAVTLALSPFTPLGAAGGLPAGTRAGEGLSLNPLLRTPWVNIHPPMVFIAFSSLTILFAGSLAHLASGGLRERSWERATRSYARLSWLLLGFANALGAFWSYEVLGWGGFWAWDPVETSLLLPWLVLTAHLHAAARFRARGEFPVAAPALGGLAFVLVLYEAFVTRSGFFNSVHAFAASPAGPYLLAMVAGAGLATAVATLRAYRRFSRWRLSQNPPRESEGSGGQGSALGFLRQDGTVFLAVVLGLLGAAAIAGGFLTHPPLLQAATGLKIAYTREKYDLWLTPLFLGAALLMGYFLDRNRRLPVLAAFAGTTFATSFAAPWPGLTLLPHDSPFYLSLGPIERFLSDRSKLALLPPLAYMALGAWPRLREVRWSRGSARRIALGAVHGGVLLVAIGYAASSVAAFSPGEGLSVAPGGSEPLGSGLRISSIRGEVVGSVASSEEVGGLFLSEVVAGEARVVVGSEEPLPGPRVRAEGRMGAFSGNESGPLTVMLAEEIGPARGSPRLVQRARLAVDGAGGVAEFEEDALWGTTTRPYIRPGLLSDTYVVFQGLLDDGTVALTVKEVPLASLVWIGVGLMVGGGSALIVVARPRRRAEDD